MPIRFSNQQERAVIAQRELFNAMEEDMAARYARVANANMIGNAQTLPRDVWESWDRDSIRIQRDSMPLYDRLASRVGRSIDIGVLLEYFGKTGDNSEARVSMDGTAKTLRDAPDIEYEATPVPIIHSGWSWGWRMVQAAEARGWDGLDVAARENATYKVATKVTSHLLDGNSQIVHGGNQLYGMRNYPGRNTRSTGVTLNGATGAQWVSEIKALLTLNHNDNFKVPQVILLNWTDWFYAANTDYSTAYPNKTILQRVAEIAGIQEIVPVPDLAADEIFAYVENRRVIEVVSAMPMVTRPLFRANMTDNYEFEIMTATATIFKRDSEGNCGIAHST